jgi:hypothetical protein
MSLFLDPIILNDNNTIGSESKNNLLKFNGPAVNLNGELNVNDGLEAPGFKIKYDNTTKTLNFLFIGT